MSEAKKVLYIEVSEEQHRKLKSLAAGRGLSIKTLVLKAIDAELEGSLAQQATEATEAQVSTQPAARPASPTAAPEPARGEPEARAQPGTLAVARANGRQSATEIQLVPFED